MTYAGFAGGGDHESGGMPDPDDTPDYDLDYNLDYDTDDDGSIGYEALDNGKFATLTTTIMCPLLTLIGCRAWRT